MGNELTPVGEDQDQARGEERGEDTDDAEIPDFVWIDIEASRRDSRGEERDNDRDGGDDSSGGDRYGT